MPKQRFDRRDTPSTLLTRPKGEEGKVIRRVTIQGDSVKFWIQDHYDTGKLLQVSVLVENFDEFEDVFALVRDIAGEHDATR